MIDFFTSTLLALCSVILLAASTITQPVRFTCPGKMYISNGIRLDGSFVCEFELVGGENWAPRRYAGELEGQLYCTGGARAIVVNERTVGCQR